LETIENHQKLLPKETDPTISDAQLRRSTHISNTSEGIQEENSHTYTQFPAEEKEPVNVSLLCTGHTHDGYMHFTFNDNEWCNLSNEDDPVSYKDAFSQPDAQQWQAADKEEMRSL